MSSLSGLNAAPSTAIRWPRNEPSHCSRARSTIRERRRMLIASTSRRKVSAWSAPSSPARAMKARMSLGRQPPPKPSPAPRNLRPIRSSWPMRVGQRDDVGAGRLAHLGHRVDEGDLGGQERVRRRLDQLGRGEVGDDRAASRRPGTRRTPRRGGSAAAGRARRRRPAGRGAAVSSIARPSRRNSGFQASCTSAPAGACAASRAASRAAVPTGTVDLPTTSVGRRRCGASSVDRGVDVGQVGRELAGSLRGARRR